MKITYMAATSLDGFIARKDGDVSWLDDLEIAPEETGLEDFFSSVDGLIMGRMTYEFVQNYGKWPYENKPTWVCTHHELPAMDGAALHFSDNIENVIADANSKRLQHLWLVGGGKLASAFLNNGLITDLSISEMPISLGAGIPLFAAHDLDQLSFDQKSITQKSGFRQIEIVLKPLQN